MKKHLLIILALLMAVPFSSFSMNKVQSMVRKMQVENHFDRPDFDLKSRVAYPYAKKSKQKHFLMFHKKLAGLSYKYSHYYLIIPSMHRLTEITQFYIAGLYSTDVFKKLIKANTCFSFSQKYAFNNILRTRLVVAKDQDYCKDNAFIVKHGY